MLKKHSKLVVLLVMVTFLFTLVASAGAATFTDVSGSGAEAAAIYKLNALGIIDGYPDGTFGADNTITRAEFAKIAVYTSGLQNVATGMKASPSPFKDVNTSAWYNGWVNVAAAQGFVKGYSDGKFYPDKEVTQAEAITVLLRILGYNDNLAGNWPSDYIGKAANLGILDDVTFDAYGSATRGVVCTMASETLDQNVVSYIASDNYFSETANGPVRTLLVSKFKDWNNVVEKQLITAVSLLDNKVKFDTKDMTANTTGSVTLAKDCVFANATFWGEAAFRFVDYVKNDDGDVAYVKVRDYQVIKNVAPDKIELTSATQVKIDGKLYKKAANFAAVNTDPANYDTAVWVGNGLKLDAYLDALAPYGFSAVDGVDFILNKDDEIAFVRIFGYTTNKAVTNSAINPLFGSVGIVKDVVAKSGKVTFKNSVPSLTLDPDNPEDYYLTKNGAPCKFEDIKPGDAIWTLNKFGMSKALTNDGGFVVDFNVPVTGKFSAYETKTWAGPIGSRVSKVTIGDKTYSVALKGTLLLSTDGGDSVAPYTALTDLDEILDKDVTAYLNPTGKVAFITTNGTGDSGKIIGQVNDIGPTLQTMGPKGVQLAIEVLKSDGTLASYTYDSDSQTYINGAAVADLTAANLIPGNFGIGSMVELTLTSKGYIDTLKSGSSIANHFTGAAAITGDEDNNTVTIGGLTYDATKAIAYDYVTASGDDAAVVSAADLIDAADSTVTFGGPGNDVSAFEYVAKDGVLKYIATISNAGQGIGGKGNLAMVAGTGRDSTDDYLMFLKKDGTKSKVYVKSGSALKKDLIYYNLSGGDAAIVSWSAVTGAWSTGDRVTGATLYITSKSGNILGFNTTNGSLTATAQYGVDSDTLYFNVEDDDPVVSSLDELGVGDRVKIYKKDNSAIGAIVVLD